MMRDADAENPETEEVVLSGEINSGPMLSDEISFLHVEPPKTIEEANFRTRRAVFKMQISGGALIACCSYMLTSHYNFPDLKTPNIVILATALAITDILRHIQVHRVATKYLGARV